ncbi:MAG: hypothetical protein RLZZ618_203 [Pseudomonadota bacterium]|jgi:hypothetical protein
MGLDHIAARTALVLETNNLRGGEDLHAVATSLERLIDLLSAQTQPLSSLAQLVITHDGLPLAVRESLVQRAGRSIDFVEIDHTLGYYDAKNLGFAAVDASRSDQVVFADTDCMPVREWLAALLAPFASDTPPAVVAGRTSYAATLAGTALTTLDFMYFPSPLQAGATRNFYANNVAFRHDVFLQHGYQPLEGVYRAHCQVLGLRLQAAGVALHFEPRAHTVHRFPDSPRETLQLRWMRGQDTVGLTPHLVSSYLPPRWQWLSRSGPIGPACVLLSRLVFSLCAVNHQHLPPVRGLRWLGTMGLVLAFSAVDFLGAVCRGFGIDTVGRGKASADAQALSYHRP